jgi:predicted NBD/HSP70 family sugar kinase
MKYLGAIDIGGTKTMVGIVGMDARILAKRHFATYTADCDVHFPECFRQFNDCLSELGLTINDLEGIGVNMNGMVDTVTGILLQEIGRAHV